LKIKQTARPAVKAKTPPRKYGNLPVSKRQAEDIKGGAAKFKG